MKSLPYFILIGFITLGAYTENTYTTSKKIIDNQIIQLSQANRTINLITTHRTKPLNYLFSNPIYPDESRILFVNYHQDRQEFILQDEQIKEKKGSASGFTALTSDNFRVNKLVFKLSGECQAPVDELQPKVTIVIEIQTKEAKPQILNLQTTISQRDLDIKY